MMQINYEFKTLSVFFRRTEDHIRKRSWLKIADCIRSSLSALWSLLNGFFSTLIKSAKFCNLASLNSKETRNFSSSKTRRELLRALSYRTETNENENNGTKTQQLLLYSVTKKQTEGNGNSTTIRVINFLGWIRRATTMTKTTTMQGRNAMCVQKVLQGSQKEVFSSRNIMLVLKTKRNETNFSLSVWGRNFFARVSLVSGQIACVNLQQFRRYEMFLLAGYENLVPLTTIWWWSFTHFSFGLREVQHYSWSKIVKSHAVEIRSNRNLLQFWSAHRKSCSRKVNCSTWSISVERECPLVISWIKSSSKQARFRSVPESRQLSRSLQHRQRASDMCLKKWKSVRQMCIPLEVFWARSLMNFFVPLPTIARRTRRHRHGNVSLKLHTNSNETPLQLRSCFSLSFGTRQVCCAESAVVVEKLPCLQVKVRRNCTPNRIRIAQKGSAWQHLIEYE